MSREKGDLIDDKASRLTRSSNRFLIVEWSRCEQWNERTPFVFLTENKLNTNKVSIVSSSHLVEHQSFVELAAMGKLFVKKKKGNKQVKLLVFVKDEKHHLQCTANRRKKNEITSEEAESLTRPILCFHWPFDLSDDARRFRWTTSEFLFVKSVHLHVNGDNEEIFWSSSSCLFCPTMKRQDIDPRRLNKRWRHKEHFRRCH